MKNLFTTAKARSKQRNTHHLNIAMQMSYQFFMKYKSRCRLTEVERSSSARELQDPQSGCPPGMSSLDDTHSLHA